MIFGFFLLHPSQIAIVIDAANNGVAIAQIGNSGTAGVNVAIGGVGGGDGEGLCVGLEYGF